MLSIPLPTVRFAASAGLAATFLLFAAGCGGGASGDAVAAGEAHFMKVCATCHGPDANGLPRLGKGLRNNEFTGSKTDAELIEFLKVGRRAGDPLNTTGVDMPPRGGDPTIQDDDLKNIVAYLRTL